MRTRKWIQPGWNLDYLMFLFTRISGAAILLLALAGGLAALGMGARQQMDLGVLLRWSFFPNPNHVAASVPDVEAGWRSGFWQIMQGLLVSLGLTHGVNGLRVILEDFLHPPLIRLGLRALLLVAWMFLLATAFFVIQAS